MSRRALRSVSVGVALAASAAFVGGCESGCRLHPADVTALISSGPPHNGERFRVDRSDKVPLPPQPASYVLGTGDLLHIAVLNVTDFTGFGESSKGDIVGIRVKEDGHIYLPVVGKVPARGRTVLAVQQDLQDQLTRVNARATVSLDVLEYRSQRYYVLGAVAKPGAYPVDGRVTLLEAISAAGGTVKEADLCQGYVARKSGVLPINLCDIVEKGDLRRNVVLLDDDLIFVPDYGEPRVYVVGEVGRPGVYPMPKGEITLMEAIAAAGGLLPASADGDQVRIFRGGWCDPEAYTVSACEVYRFGEQIRLRPGDRVFVAPTGLATWGRALAAVFPFISLPTTAIGIAGSASALGN